jgi:hypothetical protein
MICRANISNLSILFSEITADELAAVMVSLGNPRSMEEIQVSLSIHYEYPDHSYPSIIRCLGHPAVH